MATTITIAKNIPVIILLLFCTLLFCITCIALKIMILNYLINLKLINTVYYNEKIYTEKKKELYYKYVNKNKQTKKVYFFVYISV